MELVYFYSFTTPRKGVLGEAKLENGVLHGDSVSSPIIESLRKQSPEKTDTELFAVLKDNFVSGTLFTLPKVFTGEAVARYVG